jgi:hypothetical protein
VHEENAVVFGEIAVNSNKLMSTLLKPENNCPQKR